MAAPELLNRRQQLLRPRCPRPGQGCLQLLPWPASTAAPLLNILPAAEYLLPETSLQTLSWNGTTWRVGGVTAIWHVSRDASQDVSARTRHLLPKALPGAWQPGGAARSQRLPLWALRRCPVGLLQLQPPLARPQPPLCRMPRSCPGSSAALLAPAPQQNDASIVRIWTGVR